MEYNSLLKLVSPSYSPRFCLHPKLKKVSHFHSYLKSSVHNFRQYLEIKNNKHRVFHQFIIKPGGGNGGFVPKNNDECSLVDFYQKTMTHVIHELCHPIITPGIV